MVKLPCAKPTVSRFSIQVNCENHGKYCVNRLLGNKDEWLVFWVSIGKSNDNVGGEEFFYARKEGGLPEVLEDAWGSDEVHQTQVLAGQTDEVLGSCQRETEVRWVVLYELWYIIASLFLFLEFCVASLLSYVDNYWI